MKPRGNVYFLQVQNIDCAYVKCGFTIGFVANRIRVLQGGSPFDLKWIGAFDGTIDDEREFHRRFRKYAVRREWFLPAPELLADIADKCAGFDADTFQNSSYRQDLITEFGKAFGWKRLEKDRKEN